VVRVDAVHLGDDDAAGQTQCHVVEEDTLTLDVEDVGYYTLMWTPTAAFDRPAGYTFEDGVLGDVDRPEALALGLGFALSEALIRSPSDIRSLSICPDNPGVVQLQLRDPAAVTVQRRDVIVNSSCGVCGAKEILEDNILALEPVPDGLHLDHADLLELMERMREQQVIFEQTGGAHGAAIFDRQGQVLAVAEDLGRHNALDKAIGAVLLERGDTRGCGVVLSSRLSLEMVVKAIRAGLEIMLAVSAPTSLAVEIAGRYGVTLCGFVRDRRATVYTHDHRIRVADRTS
jgi:FdhD protein